MLVLRLQRVGRKKLAHFRLVAQEHSLSPKSGRVVEQLGSFNPYTKDFTFKKEAIEKRLSNGAQPSNRVARLLKDNGVDLPSWVKITEKHSKPKKEPIEKPEAEKTPEAPSEEAPKEQPADEKQKEPTPTEEKSEEASA
ncbi:30S ribosomal protein S16 [Candidatus Saccharibacteria bacterium]|nr:30S ribosomal protein S16 [Candidatus Saccharibacteria bacterium]MBP9131890.1 30S ribosomal protein S16 [Candidatus Saccharibacteria bacterium]